MKNKMTKEEQDILESFEKVEWKSVSGLEKEKKRYRKSAAATFRKDKRINIRISQRDLELLRKKALEEGIPYQTLMSSVLHKFVNRPFREKSA
jgi:predicted DNA binding CopG/RHH family protein